MRRASRQGLPRSPRRITTLRSSPFQRGRGWSRAALRPRRAPAEVRTPRARSAARASLVASMWRARLAVRRSPSIVCGCAEACGRAAPPAFPRVSQAASRQRAAGCRPPAQALRHQPQTATSGRASSSSRISSSSPVSKSRPAPRTDGLAGPRQSSRRPGSTLLHATDALVSPDVQACPMPAQECRDRLYSSTASHGTTDRGRALHSGGCDARVLRPHQLDGARRARGSGVIQVMRLYFGDPGRARRHQGDRREVHRGHGGGGSGCRPPGRRCAADLPQRSMQAPPRAPRRIPKEIAVRSVTTAARGGRRPGDVRDGRCSNVAARLEQLQRRPGRCWGERPRRWYVTARVAEVRRSSKRQDRARSGAYRARSRRSRRRRRMQQAPGVERSASSSPSVETESQTKLWQTPIFSGDDRRQAGVGKSPRSRGSRADGRRLGVAPAAAFVGKGITFWAVAGRAPTRRVQDGTRLRRPGRNSTIVGEDRSGRSSSVAADTVSRERDHRGWGSRGGRAFLRGGAPISPGRLRRRHPLGRARAARPARASWRA